jgi:hypothetical protein
MRLPDPAAEIHAFDVGQPIPTLETPLTGTDTLAFDLDAVYQHTFMAGPWRALIDYEREPERLSSYHERDQERIRHVLTAIKSQLSATAVTATTATTARALTP